MINHLTFSQLSLLRQFFTTKHYLVETCKKSNRGFVRGVVNFELVCVCGIFLIERTYIPSDCWKRARRRYVSLDSFINEVTAKNFSVYINSIDDLPF